MFGHLGAKIGEQEGKMQQMTEKVGLLKAWREEGVTQGHASDLGTPPLRNILGGWSSHLHLERLWMELSTDQVTQQVPCGTWRIYVASTYKTYKYLM